MADSSMSRVEAFLSTGDPSGLQTAAEVVAAACRWNHDGGFDALRALLAHPMAGRAAALVAFWRTGADLLADCETVADAAAEYDDEAAAAMAFCLEIEARILRGELEERGIAFDPADDDGTDWTSGGDLAYPVAEVLFRPARGTSWRDAFA